MQSAKPEQRCDGCGAVVEGGRTGCQATWNEMMAQGMSDARYARSYRLAFDTYCMQHPEIYGVSVKSYIAHLTGLCCGLEYKGDLRAYASIPLWMNGSVTLEKPDVLQERGKMTVCDLKKARSAEQHTKLVRLWAETVWAAYEPQHQLAREWLHTAVKFARLESIARSRDGAMAR